MKLLIINILFCAVAWIGFMLGSTYQREALKQKLTKDVCQKYFNTDSETVVIKREKKRHHFEDQKNQIIIICEGKEVEFPDLLKEQAS